MLLMWPKLQTPLLCAVMLSGTVFLSRQVVFPSQLSRMPVDLFDDVIDFHCFEVEV